MSTGHTERDPAGPAGPATEEELRAAYEAELKKIRVDQILLENVVSLINLGMRRTGLAPGTDDERDLEQVRVAIESIRALMPIVEQTSPEQATPIREALSQLQLAFVRLGGAPAPAGAGGGESRAARLRVGRLRVGRRRAADRRRAARRRSRASPPSPSSRLRRRPASRVRRSAAGDSGCPASRASLASR